MTTQHRHPPGDRITAALAANRLGVPAVAFFVLSAAGPLSVIAGVVTTGYAVTGITGLPIAFLVVGAVLALFAVGYVAMARYMANAGAFYTYVTHGLGRPAGVAAAWGALLAYNSIQVALYGVFGAASVPLLAAWLGITLPWWVIALVAWALVLVLGLSRVDLNGRVLAVLLTAEIAIILLFDLADLFNPAGASLAWEALSPAALFSPGIGALLVIAILGFVGFEAAVVFSEESRDPRRTIPAATYLSVAVIAGVYALSSWVMQVAIGPANIAAVARRDSAETIFILAADHMGDVIATIGRVLFITSTFAAMLSFHNTSARYLFALGRERVLPEVFGRTTARTGAPKTGSIAQSCLGLLVIVVYAILGLDPMVQLFYFGGTLGGFGILVLLTVTAISVPIYFARNPHTEPRTHALIAPVAAAIILVVMLGLAVTNFATLLGVPEGEPLAVILPSLYGIAAVLGLIWAFVLQRHRPGIYHQIGQGAKAVAS
ncbi:APC family permease [Nonomuraea sp. NPDC050394]|uniref:APC family permease n=1 Tax=Nonomuraea sp. NPDC050394 TaxID=3364363 RepID=UPI00378F8976